MPSEEQRSTYRIQLTPEFGFERTRLAVPYLAGLGVTHIYLSPILESVPGSTHGYDVVDHGRIRKELGGAEGFEALASAASQHGLGILLDIVPNHMSITASSNKWWMDVLEDGELSRYASYFDIGWTISGEPLFLPVLEDRYGKVLEAGLVRINLVDGLPVVGYREHSFPLSPDSLALVLTATAHPDLTRIANELGALPKDAGERSAQKSKIKREVAETLASKSETGAALERVVDQLSADLNRIHEVLEMQSYRLGYWRKGLRDFGYRTFFDITTLAGLRVEDDEVFDKTHATVLELVVQGSVAGLRVDHVDGLRCPKRYLEKLKSESGAWIVVEKILAEGEELREDWPVEGTTGYEFLALVNGLFVDGAGRDALSAMAEEQGGVEGEFEEASYRGKLEVIRGILAGDVLRLSALLSEVAEGSFVHRDYTRSELHAALTEVVACCPVYRTYFDGAAEDDRDLEIVRASVEAAKRRRPDLDAEIFDLIASAWSLSRAEASAADFGLRLQQTTSPVAAKGVEDTAFYRHLRLISLNEVGGDPGVFGTSVEAFHQSAIAATLRPWSLLATSTHDTKRSEDVRARLALLSEIPQEWAAAVGRWAALNSKHKTIGSPDGADEYLLYQTLFGAFPIDADRAAAYMLKAAREAKRRTSWTEPDEEYEKALESFVRSVVADERFVNDLSLFVGPLIARGRVNSLSQLLIKLTFPGTPDIYQGTESWDHSLVDPDNRRPVDFAARQTALQSAREGATPKLGDDGLSKTFVMSKGLEIRERMPEAFGPGSRYVPWQSSGRAVAYSRESASGDSQVGVVVPRFVTNPVPDEEHLHVPFGSWRDVLSGLVHQGGRLSLNLILSRFPVALLVREGDG
ncbi:MAG TPA: malto-oligosyltrehalose synthase [Actinomycetota bacterium]|nr:malto-oligosyltrehalose synthase [Actinomycetota bacterium]